jgi:hypothetical protein
MEKLGFLPAKTREKALLTLIPPYLLTRQILADMIIGVQNTKSEARNLEFDFLRGHQG